MKEIKVTAYGRWTSYTYIELRNLLQLLLVGWKKGGGEMMGAM
jgi:hypothetical protein